MVFWARGVESSMKKSTFYFKYMNPSTKKASILMIFQKIIKLPSVNIMKKNL